jgi:hypothetical protein
MTHSAEWTGRYPVIARVWPRRQALNKKDARQHNQAICTPPPCGAVVFLAAARANLATRDITT